MLLTLKERLGEVNFVLNTSFKGCCALQKVYDLQYVEERFAAVTLDFQHAKVLRRPLTNRI